MFQKHQLGTCFKLDFSYSGPSEILGSDGKQNTQC